jgi:C-terminal processing protease CtpA/Prc
MNRSCSTLWRCALFFLALGAVAGCGKKTSDMPADLITLQQALQLIHERYVDEEIADVDRLVASSLEGMLQAIDPHAGLVPRNGVVKEPASGTLAGVPWLETHAQGDPLLLTVRVFAFEAALARQIREQESAMRLMTPAGILLDLRGSHGQDYAAAASLAEWFLPANTVLGSLLERQRATPTVLICRRPPLWAEVPLLVLIDRETSGAGEWLAAALRFHERARLAGEPTPGRAIIQSTVPLTADWSLRLSTGRALGPDGRPIDAASLTPEYAMNLADGELENIDWFYVQGLTLLKEQL